MTKRYFRAFDGGATFIFVATDLEHAKDILSESGTEIEHPLEWEELDAAQAAAKNVHLDDVSVPLDQCDLGDWFSSEY